LGTVLEDPAGTGQLIIHWDSPGSNTPADQPVKGLAVPWQTVKTSEGNGTSSGMV
jgi:hypothetical protein